MMELESTLRRLAPGLLRCCLGWTGEAGLAEDASQEALAALVQRWRRLGPPESPEAFVFAVARRRARRALLRRRLLQPLEALLDGHASLPSAEERAIQKAELDRVLRAMGGLAPKEREALLLVAAGELKIEEAARVLGISISAVKMRLHRGRQHLLSLMEQNHERS